MKLTPLDPRTDPAVLADLRDRLRATRWPDPADAPAWSLGVDLPWLRELVAYWADGFAAEEREAELAELEHSRAEVGGIGVHVIRAAARGDGPVVPLLLAHGWPDSAWRYLKVIPLLTDPAAHGGDPDDAFELVIPDMPGYGLSEPPATPLDSRDVADLWAELMTGLGHERFLAAGGDIGSHVVRYLALRHPERVAAVHRMDAGLPPLSPELRNRVGQEERDWFDRIADWGAREGAYAAMHRTKPDTAAVGLTDSPAGLAAWVVEKLRAWSDCGGDVERVFSRDEILTLLTQQWAAGTIGASMRMYAANGAIPQPEVLRRVEVPSGFSLFAKDISQPPQAWIDRVANAVSVVRHERGGHFAPFEVPELYVADLREFFRPYRAAVAS